MNAPIPKTEFHVTDEASANWLLRKLANLEAERARVKAQAAEMIAALDADTSRLLDLYGAELEAFARETLAAKGGRRKSLPLLQGTLAFRTLPAALRVTDPEAAFIHARTACPELIETRHELNTVAYRELAEATGELLPGVEAVPERESFRVRFGSRGEKGGAE